MAGQGSRSAMLVILGTVAVVLLSCMGAEATDFKVGDNATWTIPQTNGANYYQSWSDNHTFSVNDSLVFTYNNSVHNVWSLQNSTLFDNCDFSGGNAVDKGYNNGTLSLTLTANGTFYYGCKTDKHCPQGMKVKVVVGNGSAPAPAPNSASRTAMGFGTAAAVVSFAAFFFL